MSVALIAAFELFDTYSVKKDRVQELKPWPIVQKHDAKVLSEH